MGEIYFHFAFTANIVNFSVNFKRYFYHYSYSLCTILNRVKFMDESGPNDQKSWKKLDTKGSIMQSEILILDLTLAYGECWIQTIWCKISSNGHDARLASLRWQQQLLNSAVLSSDHHYLIILSTSLLNRTWPERQRSQSSKHPHHPKYSLYYA